MFTSPSLRFWWWCCHQVIMLPSPLIVNDSGKDFLLTSCYSFLNCHFMYMGVLPAYICTPCMSRAHRGQRGCWIPWNRSYRWLWDTIWMLRIEPQSFAGTAGVLNHWAFYLSSLSVFKSWSWWLDEGDKANTLF